MISIVQMAIMFRVELDPEPTLIPGPECLELAFMSAHEVPEGEFRVAFSYTQGRAIPPLRCDYLNDACLSSEK